MGNLRTPLKTDRFYHVYNHANGNDELFLSDDNFKYFLSLSFRYLNPISDIYAYCLMPNHFHYLLRFKSEKEVLRFYLEKHPGATLSNYVIIEHFTSAILSRQFGNFFNAYSKAFNAQNERKGSLFRENFKRKEIFSELYLIKLIHYIHMNPVKDNFINTPDQWPYSSYNTIINKSKSINKKEEVF